MKSIISKLMVLMAMSFLVSNNQSFAASKTEQLKREAKTILATTQREIHKHGIGIGLGQTFLWGNFENKGDDKITTDLYYSYTASFSFDLLLNAHFSSHQYKKKAVWLRGYTMSIKARTYEYDAFSPFLLGGLGFYMPQIKSSEGKTSEEKYTFGFNLGAGVDLRLNKHIVAGVVTQYHQPFEVKQDETENVRGSYAKLLLTLMYLF